MAPSEYQHSPCLLPSSIRTVHTKGKGQRSKGGGTKEGVAGGFVISIIDLCRPQQLQTFKMLASQIAIHPGGNSNSLCF